jgi:hypothetical protein
MGIFVITYGYLQTEMYNVGFWNILPIRPMDNIIIPRGSKISMVDPAKGGPRDSSRQPSERSRPHGFGRGLEAERILAVTEMPEGLVSIRSTSVSGEKFRKYIYFRSMDNI